MNPRALTFALVASVILNVFAAVAMATALLGGFWVDREARGPRDHRRPPSMSAIDGLNPAVRDDVRSRLRAVASTTREDFALAREARRTAIGRIETGAWDKEALAALLEQSREAELRGRASLENGALDIIEDLEPADRARMAAILNRHSRDRETRGPRGREGARHRNGTPEVPFS